VKGCFKVFPAHTIVTSQYQVFTLSPTSDPHMLCKRLSFLWRFQLWDKLYQTLFFQILLWWMAFKSAVLSLYIWWIFLLRFVKLVNIVEVLCPSLKKIHIIGVLYSESVFFDIFLSQNLGTLSTSSWSRNLYLCKVCKCSGLLVYLKYSVWIFFLTLVREWHYFPTSHSK